MLVISHVGQDHISLKLFNYSTNNQTSISTRIDFMIIFLLFRLFRPPPSAETRAVVQRRSSAVAFTHYSVFIHTEARKLLRIVINVPR